MPANISIFYIVPEIQAITKKERKRVEGRDRERENIEVYIKIKEQFVIVHR